MCCVSLSFDIFHNWGPGSRKGERVRTRVGGGLRRISQIRRLSRSRRPRVVYIYNDGIQRLYLRSVRGRKGKCASLNFDRPSLAASRVNLRIRHSRNPSSTSLRPADRLFIFNRIFYPSLAFSLFLNVAMRCDGRNQHPLTTTLALVRDQPPTRVSSNFGCRKLDASRAACVNREWCPLRMIVA